MFRIVNHKKFKIEQTFHVIISQYQEQRNLIRKKMNFN
jgi:hypothetical protein